MDYDKIIDDMILTARTKLGEGKDEGHNNLVDDIAKLTHEIQLLEFHDYLNTTHATPKITLVQRLEYIISEVRNGRYDN